MQQKALPAECARAAITDDDIAKGQQRKLPVVLQKRQFGQERASAIKHSAPNWAPSIMRAPMRMAKRPAPFALRAWEARQARSSWRTGAGGSLS